MEIYAWLKLLGGVAGEKMDVFFIGRHRRL